MVYQMRDMDVIFPKMTEFFCGLGDLDTRAPSQAYFQKGKNAYIDNLLCCKAQLLGHFFFQTSTIFQM